MKDPKGISKFLSLILRHNPGKIGIVLDERGYVPVEDLLRALGRNGLTVSRDELDHVVASNDKQRFAFSHDRSMIRASQGHSVAVELGYSPAIPPETLFHGTAQRLLPSILQQGLLRQSRQHVHLSSSRETATTVGTRHGPAIVLEVDTGRMHFDEYPFYLSANGVWLVGHVPPDYLRVSK